METGCHVNELTVSPLSPHQSAKLDCGFLLEKVCFPFSVQETVLHCVSRVASHVPGSSPLPACCRSLQRQVSGQQSRVRDVHTGAVLSRAQLSATLRTVAHEAPLSVARILKRIATWSSQSRGQTHLCRGRWALYPWASREARSHCTVVY